MRAQLAAVGVVTALFGCSPHRVTHNPAPPIAVPDSFTGAGGGERSDRWWRQFGDPELDALVERALVDNLDLRAAWSRLDQASAVARQAGAGRWPQVNYSLSGSRQKMRSPFAGSGGGTPGLPETFERDSFSASIAASYEVDLFRKIGSGAAAATLEAQATRDDVEAIAMTLIAQLAEVWYDLVAQRARVELLNEQIEVSSAFYELAELRLGQGLGSALDVLQQRQQLMAVKAQLPVALAAVDVLQNQLAILLGQAPGSQLGASRSELPELPAIPATGVPADLLDRRPDLRAVRRRMESADYRVAVAVANRLPSLSLSGSYGYQSENLSDLFTSPIWNVIGSILGPIFQGGRLAAEVDRNEALVQEIGFRYGQALLMAMVEVENAIVLEQRQSEHITVLEEQLEAAEAALTEARSRYGQGIEEQGILRVLTALSAQQQVEMQLLTARRQRISHRIQLYRALGGSWSTEIERSPERGDQS